VKTFKKESRGKKKKERGGNGGRTQSVEARGGKRGRPKPETLREPSLEKGGKESWKNIEKKKNFLNPKTMKGKEEGVKKVTDDSASGRKKNHGSPLKSQVGREAGKKGPCGGSNSGVGGAATGTNFFTRKPGRRSQFSTPPFRGNVGRGSNGKNVGKPRKLFLFKGIPRRNRWALKEYRKRQQRK